MTELVTSSESTLGTRAAVADLRLRLQQSVCDGPGHATVESRHTAFDCTDVGPTLRPLLETVARSPWKVTDELVAAARVEGLSEDALFELVVATALGQATRQLSAAHHALDAAFGADDGAAQQEKP